MAKSEKLQYLPLDQFITGLRQQVKQAVEELQQELDSEKPDEPDELASIPIFLLEEVDLTLRAQVDKSVAMELAAEGKVKGKGLIRVFLGGAEAEAGGKAASEIGTKDSEAVSVRVVLRPKLATWSEDGWRLTDQIFLKSLDGED